MAPGPNPVVTWRIEIHIIAISECQAGGFVERKVFEFSFCLRQKSKPEHFSCSRKCQYVLFLCFSLKNMYANLSGKVLTLNIEVVSSIPAWCFAEFLHAVCLWKTDFMGASPASCMFFKNALLIYNSILCFRLHCFC